MSTHPPPRSSDRNGAGGIALGTGIAAAVAAFVPFVGDFVSVPLALVAVVCGWTGVGRAEDGEATNGRHAFIGAGLGLLALVVVFIGFAATHIAAE